MIGVQDEDSCGKSSLCETPQACRGGSRATRGKRSLARKSLAVLSAYTQMVVFIWWFFSFVPASYSLDVEKFRIEIQKGMER
ncbi:hypothetical protein F0342_16370 [Bacillus sp. CH30_1T]|uniref:hypothetical protein n=1 Tax=Bacillus sp. CH30_1T TaxID=2604836 RepID=UPI0011ED4DC8|nr:hypothetical protein [Bacillus sp. CH30_1T]KAA0562732.1 hypothetical protein F0342_16370 [Bacillus sp. CH30_1T]